MKRQANQIKSVGKSMSSFGSSLTKNVTAPILATLGATGKMADTFEKDMGQVNTLLDNKEHLQKYKDTAIQVSNDTGIALGTVSKGVYQTISSIGDLGKKTQDTFSISARAAKGGGASVAESVALISSGMKGYDSVNVKTVQSISDMAFMTQKLGVTTYKELASSMQPLFPLGKSLNVSYQELFGSMATLTGVTGNTAEVTTQMKGLFTGLLKPTDSMSKLMQKYGYQNGQAMIKSEGMSGVLKILQKETGGQSDKMAKLFSNSRALTAAIALTGSQYDTFREKTKKMNQASGATEKALKDMKTSTSDIRKAINSAKNSLTVFGSSVLKVVAPSITTGATKLADFAKDKTAIVGMCTSGSFNVLGNDGRCSIIGREIGFNNVGVDAKNQTSTHGNEASFEYIVEKNPDYIFVMDRDAAIGTDGAKLAQEIMENELVKGKDAYKNGHIVYLKHPAVWYTAEGGITALDLMLQDLETALLQN